MVVWLLVGCTFMFMLLRTGLPFGVKAEGTVVSHVTLSFREKLLLQRSNMYAIGAILVLSAIGQWFPTTIELVMILAALCIVNLPVRYHFTSAGVAYNNVLFRPWKEFSHVRVRGAKLTLVPREGFAPLKLYAMPKRQKEILPHFQRFLEMRQDTSPIAFHPLAMVRKFFQRISWRTLLLSIFLISMSLLIFTACGEGPDASGLNSANQSNLTSVTDNGSAPVTTQDQLNQAQKNEPFAYNLALQVDENRLAINFVWTLVTGYLVMFMQAGFALVETGLCRAKNAGHTMAMNFMVYGLGMLGYYICGFAFQFGGIGLVGVPNLGGLGALNNEVAFLLVGTHWGLIGYKGFFLNGGAYDAVSPCMFLFQMVFMDTTATIPTGAMAERWKWSAFCVYRFLRLDACLPGLRQLGLGRWLAFAVGSDWAWAKAIWTSPEAVSCTRLAAGVPSPEPWSWARASASTTRTAQPTPSPATTWSWPCWVASSWPLAGSVSTLAARWALPETATCVSASSQLTPCWPAPLARWPPCSTPGSAAQRSQTSA